MEARCTKCHEEKLITHRCRNCGALICGPCFTSFAECPGCDHPDIVVD